MSDVDDDLELKHSFLDEAAELLTGIEQCFLNLEKNPDDLENINEIFRFAHNLKGSSGAVGFSDLAEFTHKLESLLVELSKGRISLTDKLTALLFRCNDYLIEAVSTLQKNIHGSCRNASLLDDLARALNNEEPEPEDKMSLASSAPSAPEISVAPFLSPERKSTAEPKDENIRVNLSRINELINNAGELVIYQSVLQQQSLAQGVLIPPLMRDTLAAMKKIIQNTRDLSMGLRMLPIRQSFQKMQRIVRDTSKSLGKQVELHLSGEETEIDKTVLEQISDPLVHLVRNAVDHGLEASDQRLECGKSPIGHLFLSAYHRSGQVVIEVREDGRGLDPAKLIQIGKSKGIIKQDAQLSDDQAYQLIFAPGFSTKSEVTDVSGRGVGMDVVKTNISSLQGHIEIDTELGKGTCFRICLPLTLAIIDGVVVRVGTERYVIPLSQVNEFYRPREVDINRAFGRDEILSLRQETLPAFRIEKLLTGKIRPDKPATEYTSIIVRDPISGSFAILVDEVLAQQQIVIKPMGPELKGRLGLMGSAILGDGRPSLILDLYEISKSIDINTSSTYRKTNSKEVA